MFLLAQMILWLLEQPANSLMLKYRRLHRLRVLVTQLVTVKTWMGIFGVDSAKPTQLLGTGKWHVPLLRKLNRQMHHFKQDGMYTHEESGAVTGGPSTLCKYA